MIIFVFYRFYLTLVVDLIFFIYIPISLGIYSQQYNVISYSWFILISFSSNIYKKIYFPLIIKKRLKTSTGFKFEKYTCNLIPITFTTMIVSGLILLQLQPIYDSIN